MPSPRRKRGVILVVAVIFVVVGSVFAFYTYILPQPTPQPVPEAFAGRNFLVVTGSGVYLSERDSSGRASWRMLVDGLFHEAALSLDGRKLAYVKLQKNILPENIVHLLDLETKQSRSIVLDEQDGAAQELSWSPDSSALTFLTNGRRHVLYMLAANGKELTRLALAAKQWYVRVPCGVPCTEGAFVYGDLSAKWVIRGMLVVNQFTGPFPGLVGGTTIAADHTYFLRVNDSSTVSAPSVWSTSWWPAHAPSEPAVWYVAALVPPGDKVVIYRSMQGRYEWYVADVDYFRNPSVAVLTKIDACDYPRNGENLCPLETNLVAASPDGKLLAWAAGDQIGVLDLASLKIDLLTKEDTDLLAFSDENWGASAVAWAPNGSELGVLLFHWDTNTVRTWHVSALDVATRRSASIGRVMNATSDFLAFGLSP